MAESSHLPTTRICLQNTNNNHHHHYHHFWIWEDIFRKSNIDSDLKDKKPKQIKKGARQILMKKQGTKKIIFKNGKLLINLILEK